jgi:large subunit ribosomal protein L6
MSLIGSTPITIPQGVSITVTGRNVAVTGPKGSASITLPAKISLDQEEQLLKVKRTSNQPQSKANHGLVRSLVQNMVTGVSSGFVKKLEMVGTGYRAKKQGNALSISAGFSHPVIVNPMEGITLDIETETVIVVSGIDKQVVGETAAKIRAIRKPEPYKGKGIRYQGEVIRRKAGKATKAAA